MGFGQHNSKNHNIFEFRMPCQLNSTIDAIIWVHIVQMDLQKDKCLSSTINFFNMTFWRQGKPYRSIQMPLLYGSSNQKECAMGLPLG